MKNKKQKHHMHNKVVDRVVNHQSNQLVDNRDKQP